MARKKEVVSDRSINIDHGTTSLLLDACERLRYDLLSFVASRASYGPPVFGPALLFLEDPREGVLRPATKVTWDDLRLAPLLDNLLSGCLTRLSALYRGLNEPEEVGPEAVELYAEHHRIYNGYDDCWPPYRLAETALAARDSVIKTIETGNTQALDQIFCDNSASIDELKDLTRNHLNPMLGPLSRLPRDAAIALGVSPETSLLEPDLIPKVIRILFSISQSRFEAWNRLRDELEIVGKEGRHKFREAIASAADAIVQTEGPAALESIFEQFLQQAIHSTTSLRTAIRLFRVAPQEVGSSLAYLNLQYRNARAYLRGHLSYEHNLITTAYSQTKYRYDDAFVNEWPLYRITQRLERLFYGGADEDDDQQTATEEQKPKAVIRNITFIPVSYFPGQIIGQVVMSTPIELDVPSLIDFSQYYIREIRTAATAEFISLIQRSLQRRQRGETIDHSAVLRAVAESLTTILSVQALVALARVRTGTNRPSNYKPVYFVARQDCAQPHDLVNAYLHPKRKTSLHTIWPDYQDDVEKISLDCFLRTGLPKIGVSRHRLIEKQGFLEDNHSSKLDLFFDQQDEERVFVVPNTIQDDDKNHEWSQKRESPEQQILPVLQRITEARKDANDSYLLLRLPLTLGEGKDETLEAILIARLWEPAAAIKNMSLSLLHTVWNGLRSCRALIRVAKEAETIAGAREIAHNIAAPIGLVTASFGNDVLTALDRLPPELQNALKDAYVLLTTVGLMAESVKRRALPAASDKTLSNWANEDCEILDAIARVSNRKILSRFWKRETIVIRKTTVPETLAALVVRGSLADWIVILYVLLKNAYEAALIEIPKGIAYVEVIVEQRLSPRGIPADVQITIRNPGSVDEATRFSMIECLKGQRETMRSHPAKGEAMGIGLALAGERLKELQVKPDVIVHNGMVAIVLSGISIASAPS